jgi:nucleotide-binding universal stress UspA family protein
MIKSILVPTSGSSTDASVFATALALARPFGAHLQFLHLHLTPVSAALNTPHVDFVQGAAIASALDDARQKQDALSASALKHFQNFCASSHILTRDTPERSEIVSARWLEETDEPQRRLMFHARHSDVVVLGRRRNRDFLPGGLIEELLVHCGRPIVIAPESSPVSLTGTIVVAWKETPEAARVVTAAVPLLRAAARVVLVGIAEPGSASRQALGDLAGQLAWHGIGAEVHIVGDDEHSAAARLAQTATKFQADLLVAGAYGHAPLRELVFGGVTLALIENAGLPVFLLH